MRDVELIGGDENREGTGSGVLLRPGLRGDAIQMLRKELVLLGRDYVTRPEIFETFDLDARGEVWPMVADTRLMAEALREQIEQGAVTGRAALLIGS